MGVTDGHRFFLIYFKVLGQRALTFAYYALELAPLGTIFLREVCVEVIHTRSVSNS